MLGEHEHGLRETQTVGERAAGEDGLREQGLHAGHRLAGGEHLAAGVDGMGGVHHAARLGGDGAQVVEQVEADLPGGVQVLAGALHHEEHLARLELGARGLHLNDAAAELLGHANRLFGAAQGAGLAREVLHAAPGGPHLQHVRGQVDVGHVLLDEAVDLGIGDANGGGEYGFRHDRLLCSGARLHAREMFPADFSTS